MAIDTNELKQELIFGHLKNLYKWKIFLQELIMTKIISLLIFLLSTSLILVNQTNAYRTQDIVGEWKLVRTKNIATNREYAPVGESLYHFKNNGILVSNDNVLRRRTYWRWSMAGRILRMTITGGGDDKVAGSVKIFKYNEIDRYGFDHFSKRFSYTFTTYKKERLDGNKYRYVKAGQYKWTFEKR